jgi:hypothetical protein
MAHPHIGRSRPASSYEAQPRIVPRFEISLIECSILYRSPSAFGSRVSDAGKVETLFRAQYNALGKRNLAAIERIVTSKYQRVRRYPLVDVLFSDIYGKRRDCLILANLRVKSPARTARVIPLETSE